MVKPKRNFTLEFKAKVIQYYDFLLKDETLPIQSKSVNNMERISKIDRRLISQWLKKREQILDANRKRERYKIPCAKDQAHCAAMEADLFVWYKNLRTLGVCITGDDLRREAILAYNNIHIVMNSNDQEMNSNVILINQLNQSLNLQMNTDGNTLLKTRCSKPRSNFKASPGWLANFCKRKNIVMRRVTTSGRDLPHNYMNQIYDHFENANI